MIYSKIVQSIKNARFTKVKQLSCIRNSSTHFNALDPLNYESLLSDEELTLRDAARQFCQKELQPCVESFWKNESFDPDIIRKFGSVNFLGLNLTGYGCIGASDVSYGIVAHEIEKIDSAFRSALSVQSSLVMLPIYTFGSEDQKNKYLPRLATGELIGCFGLTEPNHGSDPSGMKTVARKAGNDFILSGAKSWITNSPISDIAIVWAKCAWDGKIRGFIIDRKETDPAKFQTPKISDKVSLRASITGEIVMSDVVVPGCNILDHPNAVGLKGPFLCLNSARYGISWGVMGALQSALEFSQNYAATRVQFDKPLGSFQLVQKKLADAATAYAYGTLASLQIGRLKDSGKLNPTMISLVKRQNCDSALSSCRTLMEIFGGNGFSLQYSIARHALNLQVVQTYEGQSDIHALIVGRAITGIPAFY